MATAKKPTKNSGAFDKFKADLKEGTLGCAYIFYGEESYLREYYLEEVRKLLIPAGFEEFNYHKMEGKDLSVQDLAEMAEAMPMMAERTLLVVTDLDLFKLNEEQREKLIAFLEDIPPYCCVIFSYDTVDYKPNKTYKKLVKALSDHVEAVEFKAQDSSHLVAWIARRFKAQGKEIDRQTAEYLMFTCGGLMTGVKLSMPKEPRLEMVKEAPDSRSGLMDPPCAALAGSLASLEIWLSDFLSASRRVGTSSPRGVSTAIPRCTPLK